MLIVPVVRLYITRFHISVSVEFQHGSERLRVAYAAFVVDRQISRATSELAQGAVLDTPLADPETLGLVGFGDAERDGHVGRGEGAGGVIPREVAIHLVLVVEGLRQGEAFGREHHGRGELHRAVDVEMAVVQVEAAPGIVSLPWQR